jgi:hypothetical protein
VLKHFVQLNLLWKMSMEKTTENIRKAENALCKSCMNITVEFVFETVTELNENKHHHS